MVVAKATFIIPTMVITKIQSIINLRISSLLTLKISSREAPSSSSALEKVPNSLDVETTKWKFKTVIWWVWIDNAGDLHWKIVSVYIHRTGQVMLKMKSRHVAGTITKKKKSESFYCLSNNLGIRVGPWCWYMFLAPQMWCWVYAGMYPHGQDDTCSREGSSGVTLDWRQKCEA